MLDSVYCFNTSELKLSIFAREDLGNVTCEIREVLLYFKAGDSRSLSEQVLEPHFGSYKSDRPVPDGVLDLDLTQRQPAVAR